MKRLLILIFAVFGFYTHNLYAQNSYIDSLENVLQTTKSDSIKIHVLNKLSSAYSDSSYTQSLKYLNQAIVIANKVKDRPQIAVIHHKMGYLFFSKGEFNYALREYKNALAMYEIVNDTNSVGETYNDIGLVYKNWGKYEDALDAFLKGLSVFEENGNEVGVALVANNMGQIYFYRNEYTSAIRYFEQYLNVNQQTNNKRAVAGAANNIAAAYMELKNYDLALKYYLNALTIYDSLDVKIGVAILSDNIGMLYAQTGNYVVSISYHQRALAIFEKMTSTSRQSHALKNLGFSYYKLGQYNKSVQYLLKAKELTQGTHQPEIEKVIYFHLSESFEALNQPGEALRYYKLMETIKDSLLNDEIKSNLDFKEREFEASKTEREFSYMQKKMEQQDTYKNILGLIVLFFLLILVILAVDNIIKNKYIRKYKQRKSFLLKTLNLTLNQCVENSELKENSKVQIILSNTTQSAIKAETISINTSNLIVIVTLFTQRDNENNVIIRPFLYNEISLFIKNTPNFSVETIVELIDNKLLYINSLFDTDKIEICKNILVFNIQKQQIASIGKCKTVWYSDLNQLTPVKLSQQITPQLKGEHESFFYQISQTGHPDTLASFNDVFVKTANGILDLSFTNRVEIFKNTIESAKLAGQLNTSIVIVLVKITGKKPVEITLLD